MPKFSVIIPVYNTSVFLKKCLDSVLNQSYKDFEIVIINDGSIDDSEKIIKDYLKKHDNIKYFYQENQGLSCSRNNGIKASSGEYILFLDSDDFYEKDLLKKINDALKIDYDVVRFQVQDVYGDSVVKYEEDGFEICDGVQGFSCISRYHYVEIACAYCFKRSFWIENGFRFKQGTYHEDFGLIPLVLMRSNKICSISYIGYNYVRRDGSITVFDSKHYSKVKKQALDFLEHFKFLKSASIDGDLSIFNSYIANSVILKATTLIGKDYKNYIKELKMLGAFDMLLDDTLVRKIKKILVRISPKVYYRIVRGKHG